MSIGLTAHAATDQAMVSAIATIAARTIESALDFFRMVSLLDHAIIMDCLSVHMTHI
jgi:hypothetical protein